MRRRSIDSGLPTENQSNMPPRRSTRKTKSMLRIENGEITRDRINISARDLASDVEECRERVVALSQVNDFAVVRRRRSFPTCSWGLRQHEIECKRSYKKQKYASLNVLNKSFSKSPSQPGRTRLEGPTSISPKRKYQHHAHYTNYRDVKPLSQVGDSDHQDYINKLMQLLQQSVESPQHVFVRSTVQPDRSAFFNTETPEQDPTHHELPRVCSVDSDENLYGTTDEGKTSSCVSSENIQEPGGVKVDVVLEKNISKPKKHRPKVKWDMGKIKEKPKLKNRIEKSLEKGGLQERKMKKPKIKRNSALDGSSLTIKEKEHDAKCTTELVATEVNVMVEKLEKEPVVTSQGFLERFTKEQDDSAMDIASAETIEGDCNQQCTMEIVDNNVVVTSTIDEHPTCSPQRLKESLLGHGSYMELLLAQKADNDMQIVICNQNREIVLAKPTTKIRAKVQMDIENDRIWPLLALGGIPDQHEDQQYWEKERAVMKERVELFIQRMQVVQGHRRFSPWKGSITDSVVGAFLTQNVSDHLSSSAFMSVASRYPALERAEKEGEESKEEKEKEACSDKMKRPTCEMQLETQRLQSPHVLAETITMNEDIGRCNELSNTTVKQDMSGGFYSRNQVEIQLGNENENLHSTGSNEFTVKSGTSEEYRNLQATSISLNEDVILTTSSISREAFAAVAVTNLHHKEVVLQEEQTSSQTTVMDESNHSTCIADEKGIEMGVLNVKPVLVTDSNLKIDKQHDCDKALNKTLLNSAIRTDVENDRIVSETITDREHNGITDREYNDIEDDYCTDVERTIGEGWRNGHLREGVYCSSRNVRRNLFSCFSNPTLGTDLSHLSSQSMNPTQKIDLLPPDLWHNTYIPPKGDTREEKQEMPPTELEQSTVPIWKDGVNQSCDNQQENPSVDASHEALKTSSPAMQSKKRRPPLHAITGMERAHFEENQKGRKRNHKQDWEPMRMQILGLCGDANKVCKQETFREASHQDSVNWEAVRQSSVEELAETIKERGMHHVLSGRIKAFLKTVHEEHGSIDLEWLRKAKPEDAKEYLMSIHGLGVKSVECIRLLTLHHVAFPVDVNVGRICVRLGWVPIEPLPEELQLHLLQLYPVQETIQKYLWPRLCRLDQKTLYEFHYQLITFGKVFCTKSKPNCNACPMKANCKHFASAFASAKPLLTAPDISQKQSASNSLVLLPRDSLQYLGKPLAKEPHISEITCNTMCSPSGNQSYFVEEPPSPGQTYEQDLADMEDFPFIYENLEDFTDDLLTAGNVLRAEPQSRTNNYHSLTEIWRKDITLFEFTMQAKTNFISADASPRNIKDENILIDRKFSTVITPNSGCQSHVACQTSQMNSPSEDTKDYEAQKNDAMTLGESISVKETLKAIVPLHPESNLSAPKLKNASRLRTVHYVYELTDNHSLLEKIDAREWDDPSPYLLAIWSPGESPDCSSYKSDNNTTNFSSSSTEEMVSATLLIPCRTAMRGSFPLNGTYFQVNEVFADHESSLQPLQVPRSAIWSLKRRYVYFGTSVSSIFRGLTTSDIQDCFLQGYVCVRGFDRKTRAPKPLVCRLHFPASKQTKLNKGED